MHELVIPLSAAGAADAKRFGPKAANLAALGHAGLPIAGGYALDAAAYRLQLRALGLEATARQVFATAGMEARRHALAIKLALLDEPVADALVEPLRGAWRAVAPAPGPLGVVRSSALVEDRQGSSFAGQFESFLGLEDETEYFTAIRSCWCALWATRALRYMATHSLDPADTAMALIIQPLVNARVSGGGLSRTAEGDMLISATWGLGSAIAQGEVVPDRYRLTRDGEVLETAAGRKFHAVGCAHGTQAVTRAEALQPCLSEAQARELGTYLRAAESVVGGPAEIEWSLDETGFKLLQARPLHVAAEHVPGPVWAQHPRLRGHPAGIGWGTGRACVVNCECELSRVGPGDVLVTRVPGPALTQVLSRVAAVVAELGGSTSHLASLARERGIPMVLGVLDATGQIPDGSTVAVDGVAGIVRWAP
ncbi:MAG: PEP-utilizing enzyme [Rhodospirillaceae bacterium]|nr:PEP-utilizing enzyme [Rhodospirillaceae bacterium]